MQIKNGKLTLKQKKIDWARNTAALQCKRDCNVIVLLLRSFAVTIDWNKYLEYVQDPLEEIPDEHLPLLVLLGVESWVVRWSVTDDLLTRFVTSDKTSPELAKEVKKLLVPDGPADEESQTLGGCHSRTV